MVAGEKISASIRLLQSHGPGTAREEAGAPDVMVLLYLPQSIFDTLVLLEPPGQPGEVCRAKMRIPFYTGGNEVHSCGCPTLVAELGEEVSRGLWSEGLPVRATGVQGRLQR